MVREAPCACSARWMYQSLVELAMICIFPCTVSALEASEPRTSRDSMRLRLKHTRARGPQTHAHALLEGAPPPAKPTRTLAVQLARGRAPQRTRCSQQPACATRRGARTSYVECWSFPPCSASFSRTYTAELHPAARERAGRAGHAEIPGAPTLVHSTGKSRCTALSIRRRPPVATHMCGGRPCIEPL